MAAYYPVNMIHPQYQHAIPLDNEHSTPVGNGAGGVIHPNIETNEPVLPGRFAAQVALHPGEATYSGSAAKSPGAHGSGSSTTASRPVGLRSAGSNLVHTGMGGLGALENPNTISQQNPFATGIYSPFVLAPENPTSALRNPPRAAFPTVLNQIGREQQRPASPAPEAIARLLSDPNFLERAQSAPYAPTDFSPRAPLRSRAADMSWSPMPGDPARTSHTPDTMPAAWGPPEWEGVIHQGAAYRRNSADGHVHEWHGGAIGGGAPRRGTSTGSPPMQGGPQPARPSQRVPSATRTAGFRDRSPSSARPRSRTTRSTGSWSAAPRTAPAPRPPPPPPPEPTQPEAGTSSFPPRGAHGGGQEPDRSPAQATAADQAPRCVLRVMAV